LSSLYFFKATIFILEIVLNFDPNSKQKSQGLLLSCNSSQLSNWAHKCHFSVKYEKLDDQHTTVSRCLSDENEGEEEECNRLGNRSVLFSSLRLFSEVIDGAWVSLGLPDRNILKVTIYYKSELSALYLNVLLNALKLEGKNGKCVEVFPVLAIANEPNAVLVANIISLKE
jgi:positive regulator of sigma E activity